MEAQQVVQREAESGDGRAQLERVMRAVPVIVVEEGCEVSGALGGV